MKELFRVGCWEGEYLQEEVRLWHDSMDEPVSLDTEELGDLKSLLDLLKVRDKYESAPPHSEVDGQAINGTKEEWEQVLTDMIDNHEA